MKRFIYDGPLVSVIIPVYNIGENLLKRCLDSILQQSYNNLEVLIIDDCSPNEEDQSVETQYKKQDGRVRVLRHEKNQGLFATRITGIEASTGSYIIFVDADDYISFDWIRTLLHKAIDTESDIVVGEWCYAYENGVRTYLNLDPFRINDYEMTQPEAFHAFLKQQNACFSWQVVWNKLYSRKLWERCLPDYKSFAQKHGRMQMWEDFTFSFDLWMRAEKVSNAHNAYYYYYYYQHSEAMTRSLNSKKSCLAYVNDVKGAFSFAQELLEKKKDSEDNFKLLKKYREAAVSVLQRDLYKTDEKYYSKVIQENFGYAPLRKVDDFFYGQATELNEIYDLYQYIKKSIVSAKTEVVSFDIFDTLLIRPFMYPVDLFDLLSNKMNERTASYIDFATIRKNAEEEARREDAIKAPSKEDITLGEIYQQIAKTCDFSAQLISDIKQEELAIEEQVLKERSIGKELFELAKDAGKKIVIVSDMYLPQDFVERVLIKNGYQGYDKLYLSSEILLTKATGNLFKFVLKDLSIKDAGSMLHLGDNYYSDVECPRKHGIRAEHLPKGTDLYFKYSPIWGGGRILQNIPNKWHDSRLRDAV